MKYLKYVFPYIFMLLVSCHAFGQETPFEESLIGEHQFGVQFIWDGYGIAQITRDEEGNLRIKGEQYSNTKEEYVLLDGIISVIDARNFNIKGSLKLFTSGCCGLLDREIDYTFRKTGNRKYWRLKERNDLCDQYTCAYYLDIFE